MEIPSLAVHCSRSKYIRLSVTPPMEQNCCLHSAIGKLRRHTQSIIQIQIHWCDTKRCKTISTAAAFTVDLYGLRTVQVFMGSPVYTTLLINLVSFGGWMLRMARSQERLILLWQEVRRFPYQLNLILRRMVNCISSSVRTM